MHKAKVIKDSISKSGLGVEFKTLCCDHEMPHLIDNCHLLTSEALDYKLEQLMRKHEEQHAGPDVVAEHLHRMAK